jgi:hypothetical protein
LATNKQTTTNNQIGLDWIGIVRMRVITSMFETTALFNCSLQFVSFLLQLINNLLVKAFVV